MIWERVWEDIQDDEQPNLSETPYFKISKTATLSHQIQLMITFLSLHITLFIIFEQQFKSIFCEIMKPCPIQDCGRKFDNDQTMLEHVKRRHSNQYDQVKQELTEKVIENEHMQAQQLKKLPKLAKMMSKQKQVNDTSKINYRGIINKRSQSKGKERKTNVSGIIQESRQILLNETSATNKTIRPSIKKKISAPNLVDEKMPALDPLKEKKPKLEILTKKQQLSDDGKQDAMYQTAPHFHKDITESRKKIGLRSSSKGKKEKEKGGSIHENIDLVGTSVLDTKKKLTSELPKKVSRLQSDRVNEDQTKQNYRPLRKSRNKSEVSDHEKKLEKIQSQSSLQRPIRKPLKKTQMASPKTKKTEEKEKQPQRPCSGAITQKLYEVKNSSISSFECPKNSTIQYLFLNNCGLYSIQLNSMSCLVEISLIHNNLTSMNFLEYEGNHNIRKIFIDHNNVSEIYLPPKIKVFTASFNIITEDNLDLLLSNVSRGNHLEQIDLSFNLVRKAPNYKVRLLEACNRYRKIKKIDGLTVSKMDWQIMEQYCELLNQQQGLIPLRSQYQKDDRPSTAMSTSVSSSRVNDSNTTIDSLQSQCQEFQKLITETTKQLKMITKENSAISEEIERLNGMGYGYEQSQSPKNNMDLYQKLQRQCNCLQALDFLKYADDEELLEMIEKKKKQIC